MILRWRTNPRVTRYMLTDIDSNIEKQQNWYNEVVLACKPIEHWIISHNNIPIGLLNLENYNSSLYQTSWSFYIGESKHQILGGLIPAYLIKVFSTFFFARHNTKTPFYLSVISVLLNISISITFFEEIGFLKNHVHKYGKMFDVVLIEMTREKWLLSSESFKHYVTHFEE